jgi:hypothetical protein
MEKEHKILIDRRGAEDTGVFILFNVYLNHEIKEFFNLFSLCLCGNKYAVPMEIEARLDSFLPQRRRGHSGFHFVQCVFEP